MSLTVDITFTLNGRPARANVPADMSTLNMLREVFDLKGAKYACGEGECGACTVLVDGLSMNGCLMFAAECDGREVTTIEGLRTEDNLHPMQRAFVDHGAIQCGFCMPGMILQAKHLSDTLADPSRDDIKRGLEGNVCRCTGYTKVLDAVADAMTEKGGDA